MEMLCFRLGNKTDRLYGSFDMYAILNDGMHDNVLEMPLKVSGRRFSMKFYIFIYVRFQWKIGG